MRNPLSFRFKGRVNRLLALYRMFKSEGDKGLHPAQIARATGMSILDVNERLLDTPELFVRLPRRPDGVTRYRLTSATAAQSEQEVKSMLNDLARRETLVMYAVTSIVLLALVIVLLLMGPAV